MPCLITRQVIYKIDLNTCILCLPKKTYTLFLEAFWWVTGEVDLIPKYMWNHKGLHIYMSPCIYAGTYPLLFLYTHTHLPPLFYVLLLTHQSFCVILKRISFLGKSRMLWLIYLLIHLSILIQSLGNWPRWNMQMEISHQISSFKFIVQFSIILYSLRFT